MPSLSVLLRLYCIALVEVVFCQNIGLEVERICCQRFECEELFGTGNWEGRGGGRLPCSELLWPWVKNLHWRLLVFHTLVAPLHWYNIQHMDDMRTACCLQPLSLTGEEFRFHWDLSVSALPAWQPVLSPSPFTYRRGIPFPLRPVCFTITCLAACPVSIPFHLQERNPLSTVTCLFQHQLSGSTAEAWGVSRASQQAAGGGPWQSWPLRNEGSPSWNVPQCEWWTTIR